MKKTRERIIFSILVVVILLLALLSGWALEEKENYQRQLAMKNMEEWQQLKSNISGVYDFCQNVEDVKNVSKTHSYYNFRWDYSNVSPRLATDIGRNDWLYYHGKLVNALAQDPYAEDVLDENQMEEGFEIFLAMTKDMEGICQSVLDRCYTYKYDIQIGDDWEFRKGLIDPESEVYQEVRQEIQQLSDQYVKELKEFFKEWIVVEN